MADTQAYIQKLLDAQPLREPVLRSMIQTLGLPPGSLGLDVGCGIGLQSLLLADAVGGQGHVTGFDIEPEFLDFGSRLAETARYSKRVTFREGNMNHLPVGCNAFDWAWSSDCIGYLYGELSPILKKLMRVVRPGANFRGRCSIAAKPG